jgi:hypothetical protein
MNKDKLKQFVSALDSLSDDIKDWDIDMNNDEEPTCNTPGCHAGLISLVAKDLPEIQDLYDEHDKGESEYRYDRLEDALAVFLGFTDSRGFMDRRGLEQWAKEHPKLWGNEYGKDMFVFAIAFIEDDDEPYSIDLAKQLTQRDIINHWKQVLTNIQA